MYKFCWIRGEQNVVEVRVHLGIGSFLRKTVAVRGILAGRGGKGGIGGVRDQIIILDHPAPGGCGRDPGLEVTIHV